MDKIKTSLLVLSCLVIPNIAFARFHRRQQVLPDGLTIILIVGIIVLSILGSGNAKKTIGDLLLVAGILIGVGLLLGTTMLSLEGAYGKTASIGFILVVWVILFLKTK